MTIMKFAASKIICNFFAFIVIKPIFNWEILVEFNSSSVFYIILPLNFLNPENE